MEDLHFRQDQVGVHDEGAKTGRVQVETLTRLRDDFMMSWKFGMSGITPPRRAALVTPLFQSKTSTPGLNNQSSSDSCGGLGTIIVQ